MIIIDGKKIAEQIKEQVKHQLAYISGDNQSSNLTKPQSEATIANTTATTSGDNETHNLNAKPKKAPKLVIYLVGDDFASQQYIKYKRKAADELGIDTELIEFSASARVEEIVASIKTKANDDSCNGIMVQLPLPDRSMENDVLSAIPLEKDVDGLNPEGLAKLLTLIKDDFVTEGAYRKLTQKESDIEKSLDALDVFVPATALAVMVLLESYGVVLPGKKVTVIGASKIVGIPVAALCAMVGAEVSLCNSKTIYKQKLCLESDVIISATGKPKMVTADMVREGAVVIDVGFYKNPVTGKIEGDVDYEEVAKKAGMISPAVGGVGPVTIACLMKNLSRH